MQREQTSRLLERHSFLSCVLSYKALFSGMNATLTLRMSAAQRKAPQSRAQSLGKTESDLVRDIISRELDEQPILDRVRHLIGAETPVATRGKSDPWREQIRRRNWRA